MRTSRAEAFAKHNVKKSQELAGEILAFIKVNHQQGTFKTATDEQVDTALKPFEDRLKELKEN